MKSLLPAFIIVALLLISPHVAAKSEQAYTIGVVPQFEIRHIRKIWNPILKEIEKHTGIKIKLKGSPTIPDFEKEFTAGTYDFAYMNPYHALVANKNQGYVPIIRDNGRKLFGILAVRADSDIKSVKDLDGKKIAFPAPNALGASLLLRANLKDQHKINFNPVYVKTHSSVYLNVIVKQVTAGGGVQKTLNQQPENIKAGIRVLLRSPEVSPHPLTVHPRVSAADREKVAKALLRIGSHPVGKALLSKIPMKQVGPASLNDYAPLKDMGLERYYVTN